MGPVRKRKIRGGLSRPLSMQSKPYQLPIVDSESLEDGSLKITVELHRPKWQQWLGSPHKFNKSFVLDAFGIEVYNVCDGNADVNSIVRDFAKMHKISIAEAEISITTFFKTLMAKGLIAMKVVEVNK